MKINEILPAILFENVILLEMANLFPKQTGLSAPVWIGKVGGRHNLRIKVSNQRHRYNPNDTFVISVDKIEPKVLSGHVGLKTEEVEQILDWVKLNYEKLILI